MKTFLLTFLIFFSISCKEKKSNSTYSNQQDQPDPKSDPPLSMTHFAMGCFWCEEAIYESMRGVKTVNSGYSGGTESNPTYQDVASGSTSHAETIEVIYDTSRVSFKNLLEIFFASGDPTQVNGQGPDHGAQYRSIIFYNNEEEKSIISLFMDSITKAEIFDRPLSVDVIPFNKFWTAEEYHQDYVKKNPGDFYVQRESIPRLKRTQVTVSHLVEFPYSENR